MSLATMFPLSVYLMLAMSSFVLMYAEGTPFPAVLTIPFAFIGYLYSERKSVLVLSGWLANLMGLLALAAAAREFLSDNPEGRLLSGAHLLVYLSWLVIFLTKSRQHYWWTIALSLLQVAVSSVLMDSVEYGFFLMIFALMSIWTVSLFTLFQAYRDELDDELDHEDSELPKIESGMSQRLNPHHVVSSQGRVLFGMPSRSIGGVEYDAHAKWIGLRFAGRALGITFACLLIGVGFFMCIPRLWADLNPFENESLEGRQVKFDQKVRLGDMGAILESRQPALKIQIFDSADNLPVPMESFLSRHGLDEPYFRGTSMDLYSEDHTWSSSKETTVPVVPSINERDSHFRQHIELEAVGTPFLFCLHPVGALKIRSPGNEDYFFDGVYSTLLRRNKRNLSSRMIYDAYSPKYKMAQIFYVERYMDLPRRSDLNGIFLQFPEDRLPRIRQLSLEAANLNEDDLPLAYGAPTEMAVQRIVSHLRDSGKYSYSLSAEIIDPQIDPVEDFLFNRQRGHCEYYASSLALMLRSIGVPTRIVNGYKGGDANESTGIWHVQQRHAHAWIEAFYGNRWHTLDATPAAEREESVAAVGSERMSWAEFKQYLQSQWSRYFVSMSFNFQRQNIYRMTIDELKAFGRSLVSSVKRAVMQVVDFIKHPERWFSLRGGVTAFVLLSLLTGLFFLLKWCYRQLMKVFRRRNRMTRRRRQVEFYERFLRLCERNRLLKKPQQTPREFAALVSQEWNPILSANGMGSLPRSIIEKFYAIRYGDDPLVRSEEQELLETLKNLEKAFHQQPTTRPKPAAVAS
jgi:hypothetical protein